MDRLRQVKTLSMLKSKGIGLLGESSIFFMHLNQLRRIKYTQINLDKLKQAHQDKFFSKVIHFRVLVLCHLSRVLGGLLF